MAAALVVLLRRYASDAGLDAPIEPPPKHAEARVPAAQLLALWEGVRAASGDQDFGLHVGEYVRRVGEQHALGQLLVSCDTVGQAVSKLCEYHALLVEPLAVRLDGRRLWLTPSPGERHLTEAVFANLAGTLGRLAGSAHPIAEVRFCHLAPTSTAEHERLFSGATVSFGEPTDELLLAPSLLDRPLPLPNPELRQLLEGYLRQARDRLAGDGGVARQVARAIGELLHEGRPSLTSVARSLAQSPRALQGRLRDEGTSFQSLLDEVRRDVARAALRGGELPLAQVASLVGFADQSAFQRSYKRWTGRTPGQERSEATAPR